MNRKTTSDEIELTAVEEVSPHDEIETLRVTLKETHIQFIEEFLLTHNATQSYMKIYPDSKYFPSATSANELLKNPEILRYLALRREEIAEEMKITRDDVTRVLVDLAMSDEGEAFHENGDLKSIPQMPRGLRSRVSAVEVEGLRDTTTDDDKMIMVRTKRVKFESRLGAVQELNRLLGYTERSNKTNGATSGKEIATVITVPSFADDVPQLSPGKQDAGAS